jgi:hypothetical protein
MKASKKNPKSTNTQWFRLELIRTNKHANPVPRTATTLDTLLQSSPRILCNEPRR